MKKSKRGGTGSYFLDCCDAHSASGLGQSETPNHVRDDGSFPPKRSPDAGGSCAANHFQPRLLLMAELDQIADAGAGELGICNGPLSDSCSAANSPLVHYETSGNPCRSPFPCILGRDRLPMKRLEA